ncbi:MAG: TonB-dependent receptor [Bacteroidales bacterium]|nr:TonB-dependent receptor [Bacteroidales bacterium]MCF8391865.1 TonB-dependent receptor [Bacteroidales bacterium]
MKLFKYSIFLFLFSCCFFQLSIAQQNKAQIKGFIINPDNRPAEFSTVVLMNKDSVFMKGTLSQSDGMFIIDNIDKGNYFIMVRNVEFENYMSEAIAVQANETVELGNINLKTKITGLEEVVITGSKAMVEVHADKMVFNVASSVNATGSNGLELLSKAPGVLVDFDKNIILQGKSGVQIYINGKPSRLSGSDLSNMLEGMQSDNIESLEIISNPSAKYEAEGTGGIINIVLKKNIRAGFNGSIQSSYSKGNFPRSSAGTTLNYSGEKINFFSNVNVSKNQWQMDFDQTNIRELYQLDMLSFADNKRNGYNLSGGLDYTINEHQTISVDAQAVINDRDNQLKSSTTILDLANPLADEVLIAQTMDIMPSNNYNLNFHYGFVPDRSSDFSADLSLGSYSTTKDTNQPNDYFSLDSGLLLRSFNSEYTALTDISLMSAALDYEKKINSLSFSTGVKYSYISTSNQLDYFTIEGGVPLPDITRSNDFSYLEKIAAAYVIMNAKLNEKLSFNAGVRIENTSSLGTLESAVQVDNNVVARNYTSLFPNLSLSYDDQKNNVISASIGRRITRPNYQDLNPFEAKTSEISSWKGNPFLNPNYITNYQLSYSFKRKLVISNTYSITRDFFATIFESVDDISTILIPRNMNKVINNGLSVSYPLKVFKWWEFSSYFIYNYESYDGKLGETIIDLEANIINLRMQNTLRLPAGITSELTFYYNSPWIWRGSVNVDGYYGLNFGIKKSFIKDRLLVQLSGNDILNTSSVYPFQSNYGGMNVDGDVTFDNRRFGFSLNYKFGNQQAKGGKRNRSAMDDELRRIGD